MLIAQGLSSQLAVPLAVVKACLKIEHDEEDGVISNMIHAAADLARGELGRALLVSDWARHLEAFPAEGGLLLMPDVRSVASVRYIDRDGVEQTVPAHQWALIGRQALQPLPNWPDGAREVTVQFQAGLVMHPDELPAGIRQWLIAHVGQMYEHREGVSSKPQTALQYLKYLIAPYALPVL